MDISNRSDKECKVMVKKILIDFKKELMDLVR